MMLYEALEKSMNRDHTDELLKDLAKARKKKKKRRDSSKTPPRSPPHQPPPPPQPADSMLMKRVGELEQIMVNLIQDNKNLEERLDSHRARIDLLEADMKEILHQRMWETNSYKTHEDQARKKKKK
nr:hypothetical protein [Tanacetum cinerariifolium]